MKYRQLSRHPVIQNAFGLYFVQIMNLVLPFILVPYLARVLTPEGWGAVVFAQSFSLWLQLIIDFGFHFSASRDVARHRYDTQRIENVVAGVLGAKIVLIVPAIVATGIAMCVTPIFMQYPSYAPLALIVAILQSFFPLWYFQGQEKMRKPVAINVFTRVVASVFTILLVSTASDGWIVLAVQAFGAAIALVIAIWWMYREVVFVLPNVSNTQDAFLMGKSMFLFSATSSLYNSANGFILGLFVPANQVGFYGGAERIHRLGISPFAPLSQALYPHMVRAVETNKNRARHLARRVLVLMLVMGLTLSSIIFLAAPRLVSLFLGAGYEESVMLLRVFAIQIPLTAMSRVLGFQWLLPHGYDSIFNKIVIAAAITNLLLAFMLVPLFGPFGMVTAFVTSELLVTVAMSIVAQRRDRLLWGK